MGDGTRPVAVVLRQYRRLAVLAVFLLLLSGGAAGAELVVDGLTEEKITTTFYDTESSEIGHVNFQTEYLDLNLTYDEVFTHSSWSDDFSMVQFSKNTIERTDTNDTIRFRPTLRSDQNADYGDDGLNQVFSDNGEWFYDEETTVVTGELVGDEFNGTFSHTNGDLIVRVESHYEHLIIEYSVEYPNGTVAWNGTDIYSGNGTNRLPVAGTVEQVNTTHVRQELTYDNRFGSSDWKQLVVAHGRDTSIVNVDTDGLEQNTCSMNYSDVEPELDANQVDDRFHLDDPDAYQYSCFNVSYPADSQETVTVTFRQPEPVEEQGNTLGAIDSEYDYFSYLIGSVASFQVSSSAEWQDGTFTNTVDSSGTLQLELLPVTEDWEDGDYTNNPTWTEPETGGTATVQSSTVAVGNNALDIATNGGGEHILLHDRGTGVTVNDGDVYEVWMRVETNKRGYWWIGGNDLAAADNIGIHWQDDLDTLEVDTQDGTGGNLADSDIMDYSDVSANTWLRFEVELHPSNSEVLVRAYDTSDVLQGNTSVQTSGDDILRFIGLRNQDANTGSVFFGDLTHAYEHSATGSYTSKIYNASEKKIWNNVTMGGLTNPELANITVQTSNDNFSTILEQDTLTGLSAGTNTYDLSLTEGAQQVRFNYSFIAGSTPSVDNTTVQGHTTNLAPVLANTTFIDDRQTAVRRVNHSLDDRGEQDIQSFIGNGSLLQFTNTTLSVDITLPFDSFFSVTDSAGATSNTVDVNLSETDTGTWADDFAHTLDTQRTNRSVTIHNHAGDSIDYQYSFPTCVNQTSEEYTGSISASSSVTNTLVCQDDWLTNEAEVPHRLAQNRSATSTLATQHIVNQTALNVTNQQSVTFSEVNLSSHCSLTTTASIAGGQTQATTQCNNESVTADRINHTQFRFVPPPDPVTLGAPYPGHRHIQLTEEAGVSWTNINTTGGVAAPDQCTQANASTVNLSAGATTNVTVGFSCIPGSVSGTQLVIRDGFPSADYTTEEYTTDQLVVHSNATANTTIIWPILKDSLERWRDRTSTSVSAVVDHSSRNISVVENNTHVLVRIGPDHGNSSLHEGVYTASLSYYYDSSDGGGPARDEEHNQSAPGGITVDVLVVTGAPGADVDTSFTIDNTATTRRILTVAPANESLPGCAYIQLQQSEISTMYGDAGEYRVGAQDSVSPRVRATIPDKQVLGTVDTNEVYCEYNVSSQGRHLTTFIVTVRADPSWPDRINDVTQSYFFGLELFTEKTVCWPPGEEATRVLEEDFECPEKWQETIEWWPTPIAVLFGALFVISGVFSLRLLSRRL
ncbi:hypothetical protein [Halorarum salinum]|uniref:Uncharacterized protein n=1 Tax=Halorarum salinum TaxID=2743089 RepID=A0A7D5QH52_9EURY|nr:hypothetical protein [Halobaculum salinum]QLG61984.1 hypothetical protein HUG12_09725 [Halobaculum salinum]